MPSVLSGLQRDVASALPGCDYHDPASFGLERRRIFQRKWFCADRAYGSQPKPPHVDGSRPAGDGALGPGDTWFTQDPCRGQAGEPAAGSGVRSGGEPGCPAWAR
jgi:hypothetical protein